MVISQGLSGYNSKSKTADFRRKASSVCSHQPLRLLQWVSFSAAAVQGAPKEVVNPSSGRATLMESIRKAGGIGKAKLRNVKERKLEKKKQKEKEQGIVCPSTLGHLSIGHLPGIMGNQTLKHLTDIWMVVSVIHCILFSEITHNLTVGTHYCMAEKSVAFKTILWARLWRFLPV